MKFGWFSRHHGWWWFVCLALSKLGTYIQIHGCVIIVVLKSPLDRGLSSIFGQIHVILLAEYPLLSHYNPWWSMNDISLPCFRIWILRFLDGPPKPVHFFWVSSIGNQHRLCQLRREGYLNAWNQSLFDLRFAEFFLGPFWWTFTIF
jgi:hypothetical protein